VYEHPGNRIGVMVEVNCETDFVGRNEQFVELSHNIALQIAAMSPTYVSRDDVPAEALEAERNVLRKQAAAEGKPAQIIEKMVEGRLNKFYEEQVLLEQPYIRDDKMNIRDLIMEAMRTLGENIVVSRFVRYELGESLD
jgi:elongation factor Ts